MKKNKIIGLGAALQLALGGCAQKDNSPEATDGQKTIRVLQLVQ
ncbi:ABC transporter substrate-binding protein, partial [Enterococcus faecium]